MDRDNHRKLERNIDKTCLISLVDGMWFPLPIFVIFFMEKGMGMTEIGLILGASYAVSLILDIPSSIWADKYSRKSILLLGNLSFMLLNLIIYLHQSFWAFFLAFCLNGVGVACWTGIFSAFIYDSLLSLGKEGSYEKTQARMMKYYFVGRLIAAFFGVYLYSIDARLPFLLSAAANSVCVALALTFTEPSRDKSISKSFDQIREGLSFLLRHRSVWNTVLTFSVVGAIWDVLFNYYQPAMQASGIPMDDFTLVYVFVSLFGFIGATLYQVMKSKVDYRGIMLIYLSIDLIASLFFGTEISILVIISIALLTFSSGSFDIYIGSIIHKTVPSSHRATTLSVRNLMYMFLSLIFINVVNITTDHSSILIGMLVSASIISVAALLFLHSSDKMLPAPTEKEPIA